MFCTNCGKELIEGMLFCQHCGAKNTDGHGTGELTGDSVDVSKSISMKKEPSMLIADSIAAIKQTFSINPEKALVTALSSKSNIWITLGGLYVLLSALVLRVLLGNIFSSFLDMFGFAGGVTQSLISEEISRMQNHVFMYGIITMAIYFFALSAFIKILYTLFSIDITFTKTMDIVATSSLVASVAMAGAIIISFVSISGAYVLVLVSSIAHTIMLYRGIKKSAEFPNSPFWVYMTLIIIITFLSVIFLTPLIMPDMSDFMPNTPGMFDIFGF